MIGSHLMWIFLQLSAVVIALPDSRLTGNLDGGVALSGVGSAWSKSFKMNAPKPPFVRLLVRGGSLRMRLRASDGLEPRLF
eukprot:m.131491 g.131491  ORF g.131491 m.131491 type:complete len:81 (-) comp52368_c0_seq15:1841-2083(-)